jgi:diaminopimelate epimerase
LAEIDHSGNDIFKIMIIPFSKYHGAGNDFIFIDNSEKLISLTSGQIAHLCHRNFGIGADGLIMLLPSEMTDFEMKFYNSDGLEGSMCGNGGRCITAFANRLGITGNSCEFMARDGKHKGEIIRDGGHVLVVRVSLQNVSGIKKYSDAYILNTGSPHFIKFVEDIDKIDVFEEGKKIRWSQKFSKEGINVNFVEISDTRLIVKTYERGVENLTLSCGTGVTASAIALAIKQNETQPFYEVSTKGGSLIVSFKRTGDHFTDVELEGPVTHVFDAKIKLA